MYPWLCDDPEERAIEYWAIAEDETGLADIIAMYDKVWQPGLDAGETLCPDGAAPVDGYCFKYQADLDSALPATRSEPGTRASPPR